MFTILSAEGNRRTQKGFSYSLVIFKRMKKYILIIFCLISPGIFAAESYVYSGVDLVESEVDGEPGSSDALLVIGLKAALDRYHGIIFEAGTRDRNKLNGVVLRGSLLFRRELGRMGRIFSFASAGVSRAEVAKKVCRTVFSGFSFTTKCSAEYFGSTGFLAEVGVNIKREKNNYFTIKISSHRGSKNTSLNTLSLSTSF